MKQMQKYTSFQHRTTALFLQRQQPNWRHIYDIIDLVEISPHLRVLTINTKERMTYRMTQKRKQQSTTNGDKCKYHRECETLLTHQWYADILSSSFLRSLDNCNLGVPRWWTSICYAYKNKLEDWWQSILCCYTLYLESAVNLIETHAFNYFVQKTSGVIFFHSEDNQSTELLTIEYDLIPTADKQCNSGPD